jgi:hypothetical protein
LLSEPNLPQPTASGQGYSQSKLIQILGPQTATIHRAYSDPELRNHQSAAPSRSYRTDRANRPLPADHLPRTYRRTRLRSRTQCGRGGAHLRSRHPPDPGPPRNRPASRTAGARTPSTAALLGVEKSGLPVADMGRRRRDGGRDGSAPARWATQTRYCASAAAAGVDGRSRC